MTRRLRRAVLRWLQDEDARRTQAVFFYGAILFFFEPSNTPLVYACVGAWLLLGYALMIIRRIAETTAVPEDKEKGS